MNIRIAVTAAAVLGLGCSDQTPGGSRFLLVEASGKPLPALLKEDDAGCRHFLRTGRVDFDGKGAYTSTFDIAKVCGDSTIAVPQQGTSGSFLIRGDTAHFRADGEPNGFGVLTADSLVVQGSVHRLVYLRVR